MQAKTLLQSKGLDYEEINISADAEHMLEIVERSGRRTIPQIFIDDESIGGFVELSEISKAGKLD